MMIPAPKSKLRLKNKKPDAISPEKKAVNALEVHPATGINFNNGEAAAVSNAAYKSFVMIN